MSKAKSNLKILLNNEWGNKFDDMKERSERELHECRGAQRALAGAIQGLNSLYSFIDQDMEMVEQKKVPEDTKRPMPRDLLEAAYAKAYIMRCTKAIENILLRESNQELICNGRASMATDMVNAAKKEIDRETARVAAWDETAPANEGDPEAAGRPEALSAADDIQQRREAAKAAKAAKAKTAKAKTASEPSTDVAVAELKATPKKAPRRRRKAKAPNGVSKGETETDGANAG
jgi:hypothetical protein